MLNTGNPYETYKKQAIMTMTPGDMLTALYDGALKDLGLAQAAFQTGDNAGINTYLQKLQRILRYLQATLDHKYEISENLDALYTYFIEQTMKANIAKDPSLLEGLAENLTQLRNAFAQADKQTRKASAG